MHKHIIYIILICFGIAACKKAAVQLPENGSNVTGFLLNGQPQKSMGPFVYMNPDGGEFTCFTGPSDKKAIILLSGIPKGLLNISSTMDSINTGVRYTMVADDTINNVASYFNYNDTDYYVDTSRSYFIFSRFDAKVAAGVFQFYGFNQYGKQVAITGGYFDYAR